jgi:hypothetical protein
MIDQIFNINGDAAIEDRKIEIINNGVKNIKSMI